jgi:hypothetical protein
MILRFDDGYAVGTDSELAKGLAHLRFWLLDALRNNFALPLLPVFALLARDALQLESEIGRCMASIDDAPDEIASGYQVFFHSSLNVHATNLDRYLTEQWLPPAEVLQFIPREEAG